MTASQLKESINHVREVMQDALESKERDLLGHLLHNMMRGRDAPTDDGVTLDNATLVQQLDQQAVVFETDHPQLAKALRELIDALNKMGV